MPLELLTPEERSKYQAKPNDKSKRAKKEETKGATHQVEDNQVYCPCGGFLDLCFLRSLIPVKVERVKDKIICMCVKSICIFHVPLFL